MAALQSDLTALQSGQSANMAAIAANASEIAVNAAAIAASAAASANNEAAIAALDGRVTTNAQASASNSTAIGELDGRVTANTAVSAGNGSAITALDSRVSANEGGISAFAASLDALATRVSNLEQGGGAGGAGIPVYSNASDLPTDGSVHVALFQPDGGIFGRGEGRLLANQWLMVFDGVSYIYNWPAADGSTHQFPVGWYPAASGASQVEGTVPANSLRELENTMLRLLGLEPLPPRVALTDESIGYRLVTLAQMLEYFIDPYAPVTP